MHHPTDEPPPRFCPLCGWDSQAEPQAEPVVAEVAQAELIPIPFTPWRKALNTPLISSARNRSIDASYRQMETASEARIDMAAQVSGEPVENFKDLKITDMKDNLRQGDVAAVADPVNPVTQRMDQMRQMGMPIGWGAGADPSAAMGMASAAHSGPAPYAGLGAATQLKKLHGEMGGITTDSPALEVVRRQQGMR